MNEDKTLIIRIIQLEEEVKYWKQAHLNLAARVFNLEQGVKEV